MSLSVPQLDVFYIDFSAGEKDKKEKEDSKTLLLSFFGNAAAGVASVFAPGIAEMFRLATLALPITPEIYESIKGLIDNNRFYIIGSEEELKAFKNPAGNSWKTNDKSMKNRQYYIRHPKSSCQNILIEAKDFYNYIEDEQLDELVQFIKSHCPAKAIKIDRIEISEKSARIGANVKGADFSGGADYNQMHKNCVNIISPNGFPPEEIRSNYMWLDQSVKQCITSLVEGAVFEKSYERDFTFGLSAKEARTVGLKMGMHKNFSYNIYIEC